MILQSYKMTDLSLATHKETDHLEHLTRRSLRLEGGSIPGDLGELHENCQNRIYLWHLSWLSYLSTCFADRLVRRVLLLFAHPNLPILIVLIIDSLDVFVKKYRWTFFWLLTINLISFEQVVFSIFHDWTWFESFYFIFVSMSTIGFGDYVPEHPLSMMATFVYLLFGLALTSMCINVIQEKLNATFQKAKLHIALSLGLEPEAFQDEGLTTVYEDLREDLTDRLDEIKQGSIVQL